MTFNVNILLHSLFILSTFLIVLISFIFDETPECWKYGYEVGQLVNNLSLAYISSYFFYIIFYVTKERKDKANSLKTVAEDSKGVTFMGTAIFRRFTEIFGLPYEPFNSRSFDKDKFIKHLGDANYNIDGNTYIGSKKLSKTEEIIYYFDSMHRHIERINIFNYHLETDYIHLIGLIRRHRLYNTMQTHIVREGFVVGGMRLPPFSLPASTDDINDVFDFMCLIERLQNYHKKEFAKFMDFKEID